MKTYVATILLALVSSLLLTHLARYLGQRFQLVDEAGGRKHHVGAIPRIGGPAIALSTMIPLVALIFVDNELGQAWRELGTRSWAIIICSSAAMLLGLWDDVKYLRARTKLSLQISISILAYVLGLKIQLIQLPFFGILDMGIFALPVTIFWFVGFMNVVNLIDGMDGLCAGIVAIASIALFIVGVSQSAAVVALVTAAIAGSLLGFLRYNFTPASIFMGDSGSYFLGFILAAISITGNHKTTVVVTILAPLLAMGIPILDTCLAIGRRLIQGRPVFSPDRGHMHHLVLDQGRSTQQAVGIFYTFTALLAFIGIITVLGREFEIGIALATAFILTIYLIRVVGVGTKQAVDQSKDLAISKANELFTVLPHSFENIQSTQHLEELHNTLIALADNTGMTEIKLSTFGIKLESLNWRKPIASQKIRGELLNFEHKIEFNGKEVATWQMSWYSEQTKPSRETTALLKVTGLVIGKKFNELIAHELGNSLYSYNITQTGA